MKLLSLKKIYQLKKRKSAIDNAFKNYEISDKFLLPGVVEPKSQKLHFEILFAKLINNLNKVLTIKEIEKLQKIHKMNFMKQNQLMKMR